MGSVSDSLVLGKFIFFVTLVMGLVSDGHGVVGYCAGFLVYSCFSGVTSLYYSDYSDCLLLLRGPPCGVDRFCSLRIVFVCISTCGVYL